MIRFSDNVYLMPSVKPKLSKIKWKIACGIGLTGLYFIALSSNENDIFDIYSGYLFKQRMMRKSDLYIIGVANGYEEAVELTTRIVDECIAQKGDALCLKKYVKERF